MNFYSCTGTRYIATIIVFTLMSARVWALGVGTAPWVGLDFKGGPCYGANAGVYGPYDYMLHKERLGVVEQAHFTSRVRNLVGGENADGPTSDLSYTLKVFPNHHLALNSAMQFEAIEAAKIQSMQVKGEKRGYSFNSAVECFLQRAINYSPRDATSLMLYAIYLQRSDKYEDSAAQYEKALGISPDAQDINYNYALVLIKLERYAEAREIATRLYADNYPFAGLKKQLIRAGHWD